MKKDRGTEKITISNILARDNIKSAIDSVAEIADTIKTIAIVYTTRENDVGFVASSHGEAEVIGLLEVAKFSVIEGMKKPYEA